MARPGEAPPSDICARFLSLVFRVAFFFGCNLLFGTIGEIFDDILPFSGPQYFGSHLLLDKKIFFEKKLVFDASFQLIRRRGCHGGQELKKEPTVRELETLQNAVVFFFPVWLSSRTNFDHLVKFVSGTVQN